MQKMKKRKKNKMAEDEFDEISQSKMMMKNMKGELRDKVISSKDQALKQ